jgi:hypothetical protein
MTSTSAAWHKTTVLFIQHSNVKCLKWSHNVDTCQEFAFVSVVNTYFIDNL